ncbi:MAG: chorismate lyase [Magnetococcales bacterium]|nr:chorismate lyase [Magnetococcales bacterium]
MRLEFPLELEESWGPPSGLLARRGGGISDRVRGALAWEGSLTRYLEAQWGHPVRVRLEEQESVATWPPGAALWGEGTPPPARGAVLLRTAWLHVEGEAMVFAHSQVSLAGLEEEVRQALVEGERPLGRLLSGGEGTLVRPRLELALAKAPFLADLTGRARESLFWCRRSLLSVDGTANARILEIFLQA